MRINEEQLKTVKYSILSRMLRRDAWGNAYFPVGKILNWVPRHLKGVAKQVLNQLAKDGLILMHKNNNCASLNPQQMSELWHYKNQNTK